MTVTLNFIIMNSIITDAIEAVDSSSVTGVGTSQVNPAITVANLSYMQKQKYDYLLPIFGEETVKLVPLIEGRGRNSWIKVNEKITAIEQATNAEATYHDALYDNFEVGIEYQISEIPGIVGGVRRDLSMRPYMSRLRANCENDFFSLFIVQDIYEPDGVGPDGKPKQKLVAYKPVFKLKVED